MITKLHIAIVILLISIAYSDTIQEFGIATSGTSNSDSNSEIELTLLFNGDIYQCRVIPEDLSTEYSCRGTRSKIGTGCGGGSEIFIENTDYDSVQIDSVSVDYVFIIDSSGTRTQVSGGDTCLDQLDCSVNTMELDLNTASITTGGTYSFTCTDQCVPGDEAASFDWDELTEQGLTAAGVSAPVVTLFDIDENDLSINIEVELEYFGRATADEESDANFGVTYVLDFEDFDAHKDDIDEPGTCQNRNDGDFSGKDFVNDYWEYPLVPNSDVGGSDFLAYPDPTPESGTWTVSMKSGDECNTIVYSGHFTWSQLRGCKAYGGDVTTPDNSYTHIESDDNWLNLTGTLYINLVSPYWYNQDFGYYRVYQLYSQPFIIAVSSVVHVLGSTGINVMTMSVIAVYKQDEGPNPLSSRNYYGDFRLVLLTECSDYLELTRVASDPFTFTATTADVVQGDFDVEVNPENDGCLNNKGFICSQLWQINATNVACTDSSGTDFSGNYALTFTPQCRSAADLGGDAEAISLNAYCDQWLIDHPDLTTGTRVALNTDLVWKDDICDPLIFIVRLEAEMEFYADASFGTPVADNHLYQVGEDTIYVEVTTDFPSGTMDVLDTEIMAVHICTFDPLLDPETDYNDPVGDIANFGCFNGNRDTGYDKYFYMIFEADPNDHSTPIRELFDFTEYQDGVSNTQRFSFKVPEEVARDRLFVQVELEVELQEIDGSPEPTTRRRMLLSSQTGPTANKLGHFVQGVGINYGQEVVKQPPNEGPQQPQQPQQPHNNNPPEQYYPPQQPGIPQQPVVNPVTGPATYTINLSSPWVIALGGLLGLILTFNIAFMTYRNCCEGSGQGRASFMPKRKKGYSKVNVESEFDSEAQMIQNEDDESQ